MLAWETLRDSDAARVFLNTHNDGLGGRPIDLAIGSEAGLAAVERLSASFQAVSK